MGKSVTAIAERPDYANSSQMKAVEVDDICHAFVSFENGATGTLEANWVASGRKMQHDFEISGSKGSIFFSQERFNELDLFLFSDKKGSKASARFSPAPIMNPMAHSVWQAAIRLASMI